jgi:hypothetical protein
MPFAVSLILTTTTITSWKTCTLVIILPVLEVLMTCIRRIWPIFIGRVLLPSLLFASNLLIHVHLVTFKMNKLTKQLIIKIIAQNRQPITLTIKLEYLRVRSANQDLLSLDLKEYHQTVHTLYTRRIDSLKIWMKLT